MTFAGGYSAKVPTIVNYTITSASTWQKALDASSIKGVRKWFIKAKNSTDNSFELAFTSAPTTFLTSDGAGFSFDNCDLQDVYVRSSTVNTVIEIIYWS